MTCIIAIETATEACSAALLIEKNGKQSIHKRFQLAPREHTKLILPMLDEVLADAELKISDIDAIAFGRGPGAFTGLRIATGIAQGVALSIDKPTLPVSSLKAMALAAHKETSSDNTNPCIIVAIDARMGEVYWAEYQVIDGSVEQVGEEQLSKPEEMFGKVDSLVENNSIIVIGSGWDEYMDTFQDRSNIAKTLEYLSGKFPDAAEVAELALLAFDNGETQSIEDAQPVYLRNNVAEKSKKK
ncbi:MAG: tRNA (adenosine(37)-N6)-threonylcarbamoyltransferase complex dimerization subunit type 1 TsaB [Cocleimonas sp.]